MGAADRPALESCQGWILPTGDQPQLESYKERSTHWWLTEVAVPFTGPSLLLWHPVAPPSMVPSLAGQG